MDTDSLKIGMLMLMSIREKSTVISRLQSYVLN